MKSIKVAVHVQRYAEVETSQKLELIEGLKNLVEQDRKNKIEEMKAHLAQLENGNFPLAQKPTSKPEVKNEPQDTIAEEPMAEAEATQEEAFDNL